MSDPSGLIRLQDLIECCAPGEWGDEPATGCGNCVVYRATDIDNDGRLNEAGGVERVVRKSKVLAKALAKGDILIEASGGAPGQPVGRVALFRGPTRRPALVSNFFRFVRPRPGVEPRFLTQQLVALNRSSAIGRYQQQTTGLTNLKVSDYLTHKLWIPCFTVQEHIAAILACIDNAIDATDALIEKHQRIKAGLMHDLFTRGTLVKGKRRQHFAEAPELFQKTVLGPLPREWRRSTVGESFEIDSGITLGPHRRPARRPQKYLRVANVHRDQLRLDDVASVETLPGDERYVLEEGDLLVVEGHANPAEIARCAMVDQDAAGMLFQNHLFRLRPIGIDKDFALLWLNSFHVQRYWERTCSTSSGLHTINRRMLKAVPMFVPSEGERWRIVSAAASARAVLDGHIRVLAKLRAQKLGLMQDLLTGKVAVKLPEPAIPA